MYQRYPNGGFRARASFPITPDLVERVNVICRATDLSFADVIRRSVEIAVERYVVGGYFVREPAPMPASFPVDRAEVLRGDTPERVASGAPSEAPPQGPGEGPCTAAG